MFAFIVPDVSDKDAPIVVEEIVVTHVGRHIELRTLLNRLVEQETACTTTQRQSGDDTGCVTAVAHGTHLKRFLDLL